MEQYSQEWIEARLGMFTGSGIADLMTKPKEKGAAISKTAQAYILKKLGEISSGLPADDITTAATAWGHENEPLARKWYQKLVGFNVEEVGFITHPELPYLGGSPDGVLVEANGLLEIKCPFKTHNHLAHLLIDSPDYFKANFADYYWQNQCNMLNTGREFTDFVSFDPRLKDNCGFFYFRLPFNPEDAAALVAAAKSARAELERMAARFGITLEVPGVDVTVSPGASFQPSPAA